MPRRKRSNLGRISCNAKRKKSARIKAQNQVASTAQSSSTEEAQPASTSISVTINETERLNQAKRPRLDPEQIRSETPQQGSQQGSNGSETPQQGSQL